MVTDALPAGLTLVSTSGCAEDPTGDPTCALGTIAAGATAQYTVTASVNGDASGVLTNMATVSASTPEANPGDESAMATTTVNQAFAVTATKTDSFANDLDGD